MIGAIRSQTVLPILSQQVSVTHQQPQARPTALNQTDKLQLSASPQQALPEHVAGELIVKFKAGTDAEFHFLSQQMGLQIIEKFPKPRQGFMAEQLDNIYRMKFNPEMPMKQVLHQLSQDQQIAYAEPNYIVRTADIKKDGQSAVASGEKIVAHQTKPNDLDSRLWGLHNTGQNGGTANADINAPEAWAITAGSKNGPVMGVIDTGVDYNHPDLKANMWVNPGEIANDGIDNDNNGYVDDIHGWDFANDDNNPMDGNGHGTHVAGTMAAKGNDGRGIVGVNWTGQIMALKFLSDGGSGSTADAIKAVLYATDNGADLTNNSWGGGGYSQALRDAIANSSLFVAAAGNDGTNNDNGPHYPSNYNLPNVISVAASDRNDGKASFSNYGKVSVDLAAPGKDIYSSVPGGKYDSYSGTSMASPHVAGVAGLIMTRYPNATARQVKDRLLNGVDPTPAFSDNTVSGGRLNAYNSLENDVIAPARVTALNMTKNNYQSMTFEWRASGDDGMSGRANRYDIRYSVNPLNESNWARATKVSNAIQPANPGSKDSINIAGLPPSRNQNYYVGVKVIDNVGNASPLVVAQGETLSARILFKDDMEKPNQLWTAEQPWSRANVGGTHKHVWTESPNGDYDHSLNTPLTTKPVNLRGVDEATLTFAHKFDFEAGYDFGYMEASKDGQNWSEIGRFGNSSNWKNESVDLSRFIGGDVQIRFRVKTDKSVAKDGWKIDDVSISTGQLKQDH